MYPRGCTVCSFGGALYVRGSALYVPLWWLPMRDRIKKGSPWAKFTRMPVEVFQHQDLSASELLVLCYLTGRYRYRVKKFMYTSYRKISYTLGFSRRHIADIIKSLTDKGLVRSSGGKLGNTYQCRVAQIGTPYVALPSVILNHDRLTPVEKLVALVCFNKHKLEATTKKDFAAAAKLDKRTVTKTLATLSQLHVLETRLNRLGKPNEPDHWCVMRPTHKEIQADKWAKIKQNPIYKQQYKELVMVVNNTQDNNTPENFVNYYKPRGAPLEDLNPREIPLMVAV